MRILRICITVLFAAVLCLFIIFNINYAKRDRTVPTITFDSDEISVPLHASREELLAGVTAYDEKDGDISNKIVVESISRFVEPGVSVVRYSVCDGDRHIASATRKVIYENYSSPRFTVSSSLVFPTGQSFNIHSIIGATDKIDGDISEKVIITVGDYSAQSSAVYSVDAKVTNSKGDMITRTFPVYVEDRSLSAPEIELKNYIIYCSVGETVDVGANIVSALTADGTDILGSVRTDTNLNTSKPGMYEIHYRVSDESGRTGHSVAFVVVED